MQKFIDSAFPFGIDGKFYQDEQGLIGKDDLQQPVNDDSETADLEISKVDQVAGDIEKLIKH